MKRKNDNFRIFVGNLATKYSIVFKCSKVFLIMRLYNSVGFMRLNEFLKKHDAYDEFWENAILYKNSRFCTYRDLVDRLARTRLKPLTVGEFVEHINYSFEFSSHEPKDKPYTWGALILNESNDDILKSFI